MASQGQMQNLLTLVTWSLPCAVAAVDQKGAICSANPAWDRKVAADERDLFTIFPELNGTAWNEGFHKTVQRAAGPAESASWWDVEAVAHPEVPNITLLTVHEVTDRVLARRDAEDARAALGPTDRRLRLAQEAAGIGTWEWDARADRQSWSPQQFRLYGLDPAVAVPPSHDEWQALVIPEDRERIDDVLRQSHPERNVFQTEFRIRRVDTGEIRWLLSLGQVTDVGPDGSYTRVLGVNLDCTDSRAAVNALRAQEARLRLASEAAGIYAWEWDVATEAVVWANGLEKALRLPPGGFGGSVAAFRALVHPDDRPAVDAAVREALADGNIDFRAMFRMVRGDGTTRWTETRGTVIRDDEGRPVRMVGMDYDITEQKATLEALKEQEARLRLFIEHAPASLAMFDTEMRFLAVSRRFMTDHALAADSPEQLKGRRIYDVLPNLPEAWIAMHRQVLKGQSLSGNDDPYVRLDGVPEFVSWSMTPWLTAGGLVGGAMLATEMTTARKATEAAVAESEAKFRALAEAMPQLIFTAAPDGRSEYKNRRWLEYSGLTLEQAMNDGWITLLHPEDHDVSVAAWQHALRSGEPFEREHRLRGKDGIYRWFLARAAALHGREDGRIIRWLGTATEISEIVFARDSAVQTSAILESRIAERSKALTEVAAELQTETRRRQDIQSALLQSQKLETLGHLTAGVAHDFGNVLTAIQGSLEVIGRVTTEARITRVVEQGLKATDRAASLTRQLLDFGRSDSLLPEVLDVEGSMRQANELISHAVGPRVTRFMNIQRGVWPALINGHQLEVALLNLAVNARDAMPDGGQLTLEARNLTPEERPQELPVKDYICISVRDTGPGMPPEVLARATEPFFTTKPAGKGTGLGLPMVHGFALRSGGALRIDSHAGSGTTVQIILPRAPVTDMDASKSPAGSFPPDSTGKPTILIVDHDEQARQMVAAYLLNHGFNVTEAASAETAVALSHSAKMPDLLLTEVSLSGMTGSALARLLRQEAPDLPVVFLSSLASRDDLSGAPVLTKPFTGADLLRVLRPYLQSVEAGGKEDTDRNCD